MKVKRPRKSRCTFCLQMQHSGAAKGLVQLALRSKAASGEDINLMQDLAEEIKSIVNDGEISWLPPECLYGFSNHLGNIQSQGHTSTILESTFTNGFFPADISLILCLIS